MHPDGFSLLSNRKDGVVYRLGPPGRGARPLVLLPGIEGDGRVFSQQVPVSNARAVVAIDLPELEENLHAMAAEMLRLISFERFAVAGVSLGGLVGWAMAEQAPKRVVGLATLGTLPHRSLLPAQIERSVPILRMMPSSIFRVMYRRRIQARLDEEGVAPALWPMVLSANCACESDPRRLRFQSRSSIINALRPGLPAQ